MCPFIWLKMLVVEEWAELVGGGGGWGPYVLR